MRKLLLANMKRLKKSRLFWIIAATFIISTFYGLIDTYNYEKTLQEYHAEMPDSAYTPTTATDLLFQMTPFIGLAAAFMLAIFIGTEYHDNTMRNKLICGQPRIKVYLANLISGFFITLIFWLLPVLVIVCVGIPLLGIEPLTSGLLVKIGLSALIGFFLCAAFTTFNTIISMLVHNRSYALISCISLALVLFLIGSICESRLTEPETYADYDVTWTEDGMQQIDIIGEVQNPNYLSGNARRIVSFLYDFFPGGQAIQLTRQKFEHPYRCLLSSFCITAVVSAAGIYFFRKKDLK